jgi:hypothetical protein
MMPGLPVPTILQCNWNHHHGTCLEFFLAIGRFEPTFISAYQALKMICNLRSLKSRMKTRSFLEEIITSSNEVLKDCVLVMVVEIGKLGIPTRETAENNDTVM